MGFSAWVFLTIYSLTGNINLALMICLITGLLAGLLNGMLVVKVGIPSLIVTIGTMFFRRGLVMVCSKAGGGSLVPAKGTVSFKSLVGRIGGAIPAQALWAVGLAFLFWFGHSYFRFHSFDFEKKRSTCLAIKIIIPLTRL